MELILKRVLWTDDGVIGVLLSGSAPICVTLEEEWKDNERGISCIPTGSYLCQLTRTEHHGITYEVQGVQNRSAILFHPGNTEADTEGCILLGKEFGYIKEADEDTGIVEQQLAVLRSKEAYAYFMSVLNGAQTFALHIRAC